MTGWHILWIVVLLYVIGALRIFYHFYQHPIHKLRWAYVWRALAWPFVLIGALVPEERIELPDPHWEVAGDNGEMCHVRWSKPRKDGKYLWVAHYPATLWGRSACERQAERFNVEKKLPTEF